MRRLSEFVGTRLTVLALVVLVSSASIAQQSSTLKLTSGKTVKVLGVVQVRFTSGAAPALMLKYETELSVGDVPKLRSEAEEVWSVFIQDAENAHFTSAIVSATEKPNGLLLKTSRGYNFVYEKRSDGRWHCTEDDKK